MPILDPKAKAHQCSPAPGAFRFFREAETTATALIAAKALLTRSQSTRMLTVKVLGSDGVSLEATVRLIQEVALVRGVDVAVETAGAVHDLIAYGIMSTPGVVIRGVVVHMGGVPSRERVDGWFA